MSAKSVLVAFIMSHFAMVLSLTTAHSGQPASGVKTLEVNGYHMAYVERGSGRPLVLVHGAMNDYRYWALQMETLSQTSRVIAVSLRHYFPERWDGKGGRFTIKQHAADLIAFVKALGSGPVDLLGQSRGGYIAVEVALAEPALVRRLILAEPGLVLDDTGGFGSVLEQNPEAKSAGAGRTARVKAVLSRFEEGDIDAGLEIFADGVGGAGSWKRLTEDQRQILRDNAWTVKGMEDEQRRAITCTELSMLEMPVLLVGGEKSARRYAAILNVIEPCLKNRARVTIPDASHSMSRINPAEFDSAVTRFVSPP